MAQTIPSSVHDYSLALFQFSLVDELNFLSLFALFFAVLGQQPDKMLASAALGQVLAASSSLLQEAHSSRDWPVFGPLCPAVSNFPAFPVPAILAIPNPEFVAHTVNSSIQVKHKKCWADFSVNAAIPRQHRQ